MERYDSLVKHRDAMNEEFDTANATLVKEHAAAIKALTERYEAAIRAEQEAAETLDAKKSQVQDDFSHTADDVEGDVDVEMEDLRTRYERKLATESTVRRVRPACVGAARGTPRVRERVECAGHAATARRERLHEEQV